MLTMASCTRRSADFSGMRELDGDDVVVASTRGSK
jgi:hypothetical protein